MAATASGARNASRTNVRRIFKPEHRIGDGCWRIPAPTSPNGGPLPGLPRRARAGTLALRANVCGLWRVRSGLRPGRWGSRARWLSGEPWAKRSIAMQRVAHLGALPCPAVGPAPILQPAKRTERRKDALGSPAGPVATRMVARQRKWPGCRRPRSFPKTTNDRETPRAPSLRRAGSSASRKPLRARKLLQPLRAASTVGRGARLAHMRPL
jgi:hypothetical protein